MAERDQYDLVLSTEEPDAADASRGAVDRLCALQESYEPLRRAVVADPGFALPQVHLANLLRLGGDMAGAHEAFEQIDMARATRREAGNVAVMQLLLAGRTFDAVERIEGVLAEYPTDAPLLNVAHRMFVNMCPTVDRRRRHHQLVNAVFASYPDGDWYAMSELAYSSEEVDDLSGARRLGEMALGSNPNSGEAAHALAHVAYEQSDFALGEEMERWVDNWAHPSQFATHLLWHVALGAVAAGEPDRTLTIMRRAESYAAVSPVLRLVNWASLLWRLQLDGTEGLPWASLATVRAPAGFVFGVCHEAMVHAALGDERALTLLVEEQRQRADLGHPEAAVAITVVVALGHLAAGRGNEAAELLEGAMPQTILLGGSRAQQEVFEDSLVAAYIAAGRHSAAAGLLRARQDRRPSVRDNALLQTVSTWT